MKLAKVMLFGAILASLGLMAGSAKAETVTVSSSTVTTIVGSNAGRKNVCIQNATTNPLYFSKYTSSATVNAGMILVSSATWAQPFCLDGFTGPVYALAGAGASGTAKYFEIAR